MAVNVVIKNEAGDDVTYSGINIVKLKTDSGEVAKFVTSDYIDAIIDRSVTQASSEKLTSIGDYAFYNCKALASADYPLATTIGSHAFYGCALLESADYPLITKIGECGFYGCSLLTSVNYPKLITMEASAFGNCPLIEEIILPLCTKIAAFSGLAKLKKIDMPSLTTTSWWGTFGSDPLLTDVNLPLLQALNSGSFASCTSLTHIELPSLTYVGDGAFNGCTNLEAVIVGTSDSTSVCTMSGTCFTGTKIASGTGYIYVADSLVDSYKVATNWSQYASQIKGISEKP